MQIGGQPFLNPGLSLSDCKSGFLCSSYGPLIECVYKTTYAPITRACWSLHLFLVLIGTVIWGKYIAEDSISESQQVIEIKELSKKPPVTEALLPKPMVMQGNQAARLTSNAQAFRTPKPTAKVLKAGPFRSEKDKN
jgi:hypothetical protein